MRTMKTQTIVESLQLLEVHCQGGLIEEEAIFGSFIVSSTSGVLQCCAEGTVSIALMDYVKSFQLLGHRYLQLLLIGIIVIVIEQLMLMLAGPHGTKISPSGDC